MGLPLNPRSVTAKTAITDTRATDTTVIVIAMVATEIEAAIESGAIETEAGIE